MRLAGMGLLAAAVTGALFAVGRLHAPSYTFSLFGLAGLAAVMLMSLLACVALGLAALQVLALWLYRKLPLAGSPPRPVRICRRVIGFALFALTVPIAVHCLLGYGVQLTSLRVCGALPGRLLLLRRVHRQGAARTLPAAARLGAASRRGALALIVAVLWDTSALWYYNGYQLPSP